MKLFISHVLVLLNYASSNFVLNICMFYSNF